MLKARAILFAPLFFFSHALSQTFTLSGSVRDASNKEPLAAATIRVIGKSTGTIANIQGGYTLSLEQGDYAIAFSFIGYKTDTVRVRLERNRTYDALLEPSAIQMAEVVVAGEDPAVKIMRQVIENKHRWMRGLRSYEFEAFTRQVFRRDTAIASIMETYSAGYWRQGDTLREVIKQKRQTENIPMAQNLAAVGGIVNFYLDEIRFTGFTFIGPTSPQTFDYYKFTLEQTREVNGTNIFLLRMTPKTRVTPLFRGTLSVIDGEFALVGVDVTPNEAYTIPFVSDLRISYSQQFALYEDKFWMPVDIRLAGSVELGITGITFPRIGIESNSAIYDYKINPDLPDSIFHKPRRMATADASKFDSAFWAQREVLPLTSEEQVAYKKIDSSQTLEKQFQPSGPLASLGSIASTFKYAMVRFDRVEGLFGGVTVDLDSLSNSLRVHGSAGYGFTDLKGKWRFGGEYFLDERRRTSIGGDVYRDIDHIPDESYTLDFGNTLTALLDKNDYRDYFYTKGWSFFFATKPMAKVSARLSFRHEIQSTALQQTNYSLFLKNTPYRPNPPIDEGTLQSVSLIARWGNDPIFLGLLPVDYLELEVEHSNTEWLRSSFDYSRFVFRGEYRIQTMLKNLFFPPTLSMKVLVGTSTGTLPVQRYFTLDSRSSGFAPFGVLRGSGIKEFGGDRFVLISLEHNFRSTPFLALDIPFLYKNSIELVAHGTTARSWNTPVAHAPLANATDGWYTEAGLGLSRLFGFLRFDVSYRFARPSNFFFSIGVASFL